MFDLEIAIGILKSGGFIQDSIPMDAGFIGALSLDGTVHPVKGMIAAILVARKLMLKWLILPFDSTIPRIEIDDLELVYVESLQDVTNILAGQQLLRRQNRPCVSEPPSAFFPQNSETVYKNQNLKNHIEKG